MSKSKQGSFEDLLAITEANLQAIVENLKKIILAIDPDASEVVHLGYRSVTYGLGPKTMTEGYTYIMPHKSWVNLGFQRGAQLDDPDNILEGNGKNMRHIKIRTIEDSEQAAIKKLIKRSIAERKKELKR